MLAVEQRARILALAVIVAVSASCSRDPEVAKREYLASGDQLLSQQKTREAIVQSRNTLAQDPRFGEARYKLAEAYVKNGDARRAVREVRQSRRFAPEGHPGSGEGWTVPAPVSAIRGRQDTRTPRTRARPEEH